MFIDQVLMGPSLNKLRNLVIVYKYIVRDKSEYPWGLGKPNEMCSEGF